jgi:hypothetical protein
MSQDAPDGVTTEIFTEDFLGAVDIQVSHTNEATKAMKEAKRWASFS